MSLKVVRATATAAEIANIKFVPVASVPGIPGHFFFVLACLIEYIAGSIPYDMGGGPFAPGIYDGPGHWDGILGNIPTDGFVTSTSNQVMQCISQSGGDQAGAGVPVGGSGASGLGLALGAQNPITGGNGSLVVTWVYLDVTLA